MPLETSALLLVLFYVLLVVEFFVPSGGLISFAAVAAAIAAVCVAATHSWGAAFVVFMIIALTTPLIFTVLVRIWPKTMMGKLLLIRRPDRDEGLASTKTTVRGTPLDQLIGIVGTAQTDLLPGGIVLLGDEKVDAISSGIVIDAGDSVVVTAVRGSRVVVKREFTGNSTTGNGAMNVSPTALGVGDIASPVDSTHSTKNGERDEDASDDDQFDLATFQ